MKPDFVLPVKIITECGIYGWYKNSRYLYIGQSINIIRRLKTHQTVHFLNLNDEIHVWYCSPSELNKLEGQLIRHFMPELNKKIPKEEVAYMGPKYNSFKENNSFKERSADKYGELFPPKIIRRRNTLW